VARLAQHPATAVAGADSILAVDSTVAEKRFGAHLPGVRPVYDAVRRRLAPGAPGERAPRRRRKAQADEAPSKLDLALALITRAVQAAVGAATVVGDGAFAVNWWLREVEALALHWLVATRHDRRLRIGATVQPFAAWVAAAPAAWACLVPLPGGGGIYGGLLPVATLLDKGRQQQGLPCRPAYFERRDRQGRVQHRWYLVTSQLTWHGAAVWAHWQRRWAIEVFHRDAKQWLQFAAMHGRSWAGLVAWLACCSLRASLLAFVRAADPACGTLSTEALVQAVRQAACQVATPATGPPTVRWPPTLPLPDPPARAPRAARPPWWPLQIQEAA
jgi:hypothetical protein